MELLCSEDGLGRGHSHYGSKQNECFVSVLSTDDNLDQEGKGRLGNGNVGMKTKIA